MHQNLDLKTEIVISGLSGRFPQSDDLDEFWDHLVNGRDMISESHTRYNDLGLKMPSRMGILKSLEKFDAEFFSVHAKQANVLDPRLRKLLEVTYEAIVDAGVNPSTLQGSNVGVFVAASDSEAGAICKRSGEKSNIYGVLGNAASMLANRISFTFGFHGPSYVVDTACSSASVATQQALMSIRAGICDSAIIAGAHIHHDPISSHMFHQLEMTSADGRCKVFDDSADGYCRAEAVVATYICKKQVAKRAYATLVHAGINNDGYKEQGITFPSEVLQERVIRSVYNDIGLNPVEVDYIEAHGTGTRVGDPEEMTAVAKVFCEGREGPLLVGSVKSNMGHPEPAAGLCSISKVILSHVAGIVPGNLHYSTPNKDIPSIVDGRVEITAKNQPFTAKYVGTNAMGFGGTNVHILLKLEPQHQVQAWTPSIPLLILSSGRTQEGVNYFLEKSLKHKDNQHFVKLLHELSKTKIPKHPYRGYVIFNSDEPETTVEEVEAKEAIWYIFTGMGSHWAGMSRDLIKFEAFKRSIEKSAEYLKPVNFDLMGLLESGDTARFEEFSNAMVSINTVQCALVDLITSIGIHPDGIIGHSAGEVAAGYADGCLTHEETVVASFHRSRSFLEADSPPGTVASVGLTWEEAQKRCPEGIYPAIHNAFDNVTIAGHPDQLKAFTEQLESEGVFVKAIRSAIYGFHSPLVHKSGVLARQKLAKVIKEPKVRSSKWLSSSVTEDLWGTDLVKYASADYYANNGINPVHFYPTLLHIPERSLVLEIAPHCLMLGVLKRSLPKSCTSLGFIHVKSPDNCIYFLKSIGDCFLNGIQVDVGSLYETVEFPVNSKTPNISSMIRWNHSDNWFVPHNSEEAGKRKGTRFTIDLTTEGDEFFKGHSLDGKCVFPATGYLWLVWKLFAKEQSTDIENCPIVLENVRFERITLMSEQKETDFLVNILASGKFDISESDMIVCTGEIRAVEGATSIEMLNCEECDEIKTNGPAIVKEDFYKEIHLRGYGHSGQFQGIQQIDMEGNWAKIDWTGHWVSFLDSVLQAYVLRNDSRDLFVPTRLEKVTIDPSEIKTHFSANDNATIVKAWKRYEVGTCPGLELRGLGFTKFNQRHLEMRPITTEQAFLQYLNLNGMISSEQVALESCIEIAVDNIVGSKLVFTEILESPDNMISDLIINQCTFAFQTFDFRTVNESIETIDEDRLNSTGSKIKQLSDLPSADKSNLIFIDNKDKFVDAEAAVLPGGFVLYKGSSIFEIAGSKLVHISQKRFLSDDVEQSFVLYRNISAASLKIKVISVDDPKFQWVQTATKLLSDATSYDRIVFTSALPYSGVIGFIKCLVKEATPEKIRCYQTFEHLELNFEKPSEILETQLQKDLVYNVYKSKTWGFFANLTIPFSEFHKQTVPTHVYANALKMGELSSLSWIESPLKLMQKNLVEVHFSSLNFRDIMLATGKLNQDALPGSSAKDDCVLGLEFSGDFEGRRVFGMGSSQCLATHIDPSDLILFDMPNHWTYEDAATVPAVYVTVYLALMLRGKIKRGESILIHAGSGGVGQAAISLALSMNCKVFTTVSSKKKRDFLKKRFPSLTEDCFANSRDASDFLRHIKKHTNGRGVNLVLNCLAQDKLHASLKCLSKNGRFLEIGKFDLFNNTNIGLSILLKGVGIFGILADSLIEEGPSDDMTALRNHIHEGIASGVVRPLNSTVFNHDQIEEAFRFMAQGKHIGKVLLKIKEKETPALIPAYPRTYFPENKSYIVIGGLGGMGFELANWMVHRGAKTIILVSRTGAKSSYHEYRINIWKKQGVKLLINQSDASTMQGTTKLLEEAKSLGPIGGIFNTAVLLKDAMFENQTPEAFNDSGKCKADTSIHLDTVSRKLAPELDYFVVFSSIASGRGNAGQTNYGFSNSVMERVCEKRKADGLPALAIQWGAVGDVGVLYRQIGDRQSFAGLIPQKFKSCLETLDLYLQQDRPVVSSFLAVQKGDAASSDSESSLVDTAARILGIKDLSKINQKTTLVDLGMDSLMAAELSQVLSARNIQIPQKTYSQLNFEKLAEYDQSGGTKADDASKQGISKLLKGRTVANPPIFQMQSSSSSKDIIFIVHPLDGTMQTLETLVANLDANVYGIECANEAPLDSIQSLASYYLKQIQQIQPNGPYKIGGYSFGANVAIEMALQLEAQKETVSLLLLLDGSPKLKTIFGNLDVKQEDLENGILVSILQNYIHIDLPTFYKDLAGLKNLEEKYKYATKALMPSYPELSEQEILEHIVRSTQRLEISRSYEVGGKVRALTVLVKALQGQDDKSLDSDYGLSEICEKPVEVIGVDGNHYCFYEKPIELDLPSIINNIIRR